MTDYEIDFLVIGAGMAGLSAAAWAARRGASVVLVEKAQSAGGSAAYAGFIWTAPTLDVMRAVNPHGDPALGARLVEDYDAAIDWVRSLGITVGDPVPVLGYGRGRRTDMAAYLGACERAVREAEGCEVLFGARVDGLLTEGGRVRGAEVVADSGERRRIAVRAVLLASGGFGGDPELRERHIHSRARDMTLRANAGSTGDGLRLGLAAGAAFGKEDAGFYGHLVPSGVRYDDPSEYVDLSFYHSEHGALLNLRGDRFVDERNGDHLNTMAALEQPEARVLLVNDQRVHDEVMLGPYVEGLAGVDKFALASGRGARCAVIQDVDGLAGLPPEWGYPAQSVRDAVLAFNAERGEAALTHAPLYAIEVVPAITFTFGGLLIDPQARVLDGAGAPIPGLLAAGADAGGLYARGYAGGLAPALVFGLQAARTALSSVATAR